MVIFGRKNYEKEKKVTAKTAQKFSEWMQNINFMFNIYVKQCALQLYFFSFFFLQWRWFIWQLRLGGGGNKMQVEEEQRWKPQKSTLSNQLPLQETELYTTGVLGIEQNTREKKARKLGVVIPSPVSSLLSASRGTFQRLQRKLSGKGTESGSEKEAGEN